MASNGKGDGFFAIVTFAVILGMLGYLFMPRHRAPPPDEVTESVPERQEPAYTQDDGAWCTETSAGACMAGICGAAERTIVIFHAEWCGWCRQLQETTLQEPSVRDAIASYGRILVDIDRNARLADRHQVDGVPCIVFFGPECHEIGRIPGYVDADRFLEELERISR